MYRRHGPALVAALSKTGKLKGLLRKLFPKLASRLDSKTSCHAGSNAQNHGSGASHSAPSAAQAPFHPVQNSGPWICPPAQACQYWPVQDGWPLTCPPAQAWQGWPVQDSWPLTSPPPFAQPWQHSPPAQPLQQSHNVSPFDIDKDEHCSEDKPERARPMTNAQVTATSSSQRSNKEHEGQIIRLKTCCSLEASLRKMQTGVAVPSNFPQSNHMRSVRKPGGLRHCRSHFSDCMWQDLAARCLTIVQVCASLLFSW
jgi:hypothetical protein